MQIKKFIPLRLLFLLCFAAITGHVYADYGSIILHKAKFVMKNESVIIGYVPMSNYNVNINDYKDISKDKAFQKLINKYYFKELKTLEFKVFKKYKTLISSQKNAKPRDGEFFYTDSASVCTLRSFLLL